MLRNKKGDMTLNLIIGAAIAMVVMVVLILIFTGKINIFANSPCDTGDGMRRVVGAGECGHNGDFDSTCVVPGNFKGVGQGQVCCNVGRADGLCR
jgi:hypothetical protein